MRIHALLLLAYLAGAVVAATAACSSGDHACRAGNCTWLIGGEESMSFRGPELAPAREIAAIHFPGGTYQDDGSWYRVDLTISFTLDWEAAHQATGPVFPAYLSLAFDGDAAFQLKLGDSEGARTGCGTGMDDPPPEWSTVGLVFGAQRGALACAGSNQLTFANFLQTRSVHPGRVPVTLEFQGPLPAVVKEVTIEGGARVAFTTVGPPHVELTPRVQGVTRSEDGGEAVLSLEIEVDGEPPPRASVEVFGLDPSGGLGRRFAVAGGPAVFTTSVAWEGGPSGTFLVSASTGTGSAARFVEITAGERSTVVGRVLFLGGLGTALLCGATAVALIRRRLRSTFSEAR